MGAEIDKKKIAVIGGSFNPVTNAHVWMAEAVLSAFPGMHQVWMMPAHRHPFEKHRGYSSHRSRMIRLVETARIRYFGYEIDHELSGVTYMTFCRLLNDPDYRDPFVFYMVIGGDCVVDFDTKWQHAEELAAMVPFIIVPRQGYDLSGYRGLLSRPPHVLLRHAHIPNISATEVRARIASGASIREMVPAEVASYIRRHRLYEERNGGTAGNPPDRFPPPAA
ncbi:nicotinate (nicotinamide) nucleotide adenylyltransferase [Desulfococcus sp.]|uniref:nicotinate (nicotinamide) nucleotide adenylyltransferase n=1 Tax=Desulfococcus sp. TaxID=2025834 RepID=UPI0035935B47